MTPNILLIDDDRELCEEMEDALTDEGYSVRKAFNGLDGLALIEKYGCDILLLDLKMPGLDGIHVLRRLKDKGIKTKILVLTGRLLDSELPEQGGGGETGKDDIRHFVDGVISKPFRMQALLSKIKELTG